MSEGHDQNLGRDSAYRAICGVGRSDEGYNYALTAAAAFKGLGSSSNTGLATGISLLE